jgi:hypothetical protein
MHPKPLQSLVGVEYVRFDGCKWGIYPGVHPILFPRSCNISTREISGIFLKAHPALLPQLSTTSTRAAIREAFSPEASPAASPVGMAVGQAVTDYIGVLGDCTGFRFEKPPPGKPSGAWAAGDQRGPRDYFREDLQYDHPLIKNTVNSATSYCTLLPISWLDNDKSYHGFIYSYL